jgi:hypothetical protein
MQEKLISYLSSFGSNPSAEESRRHMIYKRASGRIRKIKKNSLTNSSITFESNNNKQSSKANNETIYVPKNFTLPKLVKFELKDAKYSEEYEQLKKSRNLRVKRSSDETPNNGTNAKIRMERLPMKDVFVQPKEIIKFVYSDALIADSLKSSLELSKSEKKIKREISAIDSIPSNTRKIKIIHPLSSASRTKHVSFEELPTKIQKVVESTISDAILKGKASDGDYLKFYYGDKIIKVPVSLSKYILTIKEQPSKGLSNYYTTFKAQKLQKKEELVTDAPFLPVLKYQSSVKYENKPQSYANIVTLKENSFTKTEKGPPADLTAKKSIYYFSNADEKLSSPVIFESSLKLPENREVIPITEDFNESKFEVPVYPTSYVDYEDNLVKKPINFHEDKNYAFGYHVSDFKSGNNFGHTQSKNDNEIKGEYSILLPDGRIQLTKYFADDSGFHADVSYQNIH